MASGSEKCSIRLRFLDHKKRRDKPKENEAIEFKFNVVIDDADKFAQDMVISRINLYLSSLLITNNPLFLCRTRAIS